MTITPIPDQGLMVAGHGDRAEVLAEARAYLIAAGRDEFDVDELLMPRRSLLSRAWWGGDERGFVQEHHDGAEPVTVVNVVP